MQIVSTQQNSLFWTQTTTLESQAYQLRFRYNSREQAYYMQISLPDGSVDLASVKLVSNYLLLANRNDSRLPPGDFICVASGTDDSPARPGDFGSRVDLVYYLASELETANLEGWRNPNG